MSDELRMPPTPAPEVSASDKAEAAAIRRRWVTLAEIVAIAGLVISGVSLWVNWSDRRTDEQEKQIEKASETRARSLVLLTGTPERGGERLALKDAAHPVQSIDVRFPTALGVSPQTSVLEPRIEANWFSNAILAATDKGPDTQQGRLPVLITSTYWDADQQRRDSAIYDIVWSSEGRLLRGRKLKLSGLMLHERTAAPARLDALWAREKPAKR